MSRRRFFAPPGAFTSNRQSLTLQADEARHLREVLRLKVGDEVSVFDGLGREFNCSIEETRKDSARLSVIREIEPARPESPIKLTLAVALLKGEKFDLVVQKTTELGVTRIVPVMTKLADIRLKDESDADKRVARWQRIALEAAKQSGRAVVPEVSVPVTLERLIDSAGDDRARFMFSERGGQSLADLEILKPSVSITALVGSEGGWTDEEISVAANADWRVVTLGGRTLRAETAAIAVTVLFQHLYGDLS